MKLGKYLNQMAVLFGAKKRKCKKDKECLLEVLKKLKKRQDALQERLESHKSGKARKKLKDELKVIQAQRRKGAKMLKELEEK